MEISDNQILFISSVLCLLLTLISFKFDKQIGILNLVVILIYYALLYYNLFFRGNGGSGFLWWFYLIILTAIQMLIIEIYIGLKFFKK